MRTINLSNFTKLFLLMSVMVFSSCKKEEVEPQPSSNSNGGTGSVNTSTMTVSVNGTTYTSSTSTTFTYYDNKITCRATLTPTLKVTLAVPSTVSAGNSFPLAGTYDLSQPAPYPYMDCIALHEKYSTSGSFLDAEEGESGTVTITSHDTQNKVIVGEFNFETEDFSSGDITTFSNGTFTFYY